MSSLEITRMLRTLATKSMTTEKFQSNVDAVKKKFLMTKRKQEKSKANESETFIAPIVAGKVKEF